jgi:hypothetical protein
MRTHKKIFMVMTIALCLLWATGASAALTVFNGNEPGGFTALGIIQAATVAKQGTAVSSDDFGGTLTINGQVMIVPDFTVVQMPANTLKWAQLFQPAFYNPIYDAAVGVPPTNMTITPGTTGLALIDNPTQTPPLSPWIPFNASIQGNIDVKGARGKGAGAYIVGLILPIGQDLGNGGAGFINFIDYVKGRFEVGGTLGVQNTGTIIEINDPNGRNGVAHSPDPRWSVDVDNPTVNTRNGYPMGLPRVAPAVGLFPAAGEVGDVDRPYYNRPLNPAIGAAGHDPFIQAGAPLTSFNMPAKPATNGNGVTTPDPWKQVPLLVGDYVTYLGVQYKLNPAADINPLLPLNQQVYISANTVQAEVLAPYTAPGTVATAGPCYMALERMVIGNGGAPLVIPPDNALGILGGTIPIAEPRLNITIRGFVTDSTSLVDLYAVDVDPLTGVQHPRLLGTVLPEPGPAGGKGNKGRFRFEVGKGNFLPATRTYMAKSRHGQVFVPNQTGTIKPLTGLFSGQYQAPMFIFQFTDAPPGFPVTPNNFNIIPFLNVGEGGNPSAGGLSPFPPTSLP